MGPAPFSLPAPASPRPSRFHLPIRHSAAPSSSPPFCARRLSSSPSLAAAPVRDCYRKQGYGQALLKAAILKCQTRPICRITLHVDPTREAAMNLYKKMGFRIDTVVFDYYAPRRDAHRMFMDFERP
ncbi:hypothetical protein L7F22_039562 [Adiantum nelumboides]|nr:hypothetical protein [Adiantum nelumboides]